MVKLDKISKNNETSTTWDYVQKVSLESLQSLSMPAISSDLSFYNAAKNAS